MTLTTLKQIGVLFAVVVLAAVLETKAAMFPIETLEGVAGWQHGAFSASCAILAIIFASLAGGMKSDVRPHVRRNAIAARAISLACLLVPISYLGSSFKHENQERAWAAYTASPLYAADQALIEDMMADRYDREAARVRLTKPTSAELSIFDFEFWMSAFFQIIVISAAGIKIQPPATEAEIKHWRSVAAGKKAAATRRRNKARKAKKPALKILAGGKA